MFINLPRSFAQLTVLSNNIINYFYFIIHYSILYDQYNLSLLTPYQGIHTIAVAAYTLITHLSTGYEP